MNYLKLTSYIMKDDLEIGFVSNRGEQKSTFLNSIRFWSNPIYLKFILFNLNFNLIYILNIFWIEYLFFEDVWNTKTASFIKSASNRSKYVKRQ